MCRTARYIIRAIIRWASFSFWMHLMDSCFYGWMLALQRDPINYSRGMRLQISAAARARAGYVRFATRATGIACHE